MFGLRRVALRFKWTVFWVWVGCIWTTSIRSPAFVLLWRGEPAGAVACTANSNRLHALCSAAGPTGATTPTRLGGGCGVQRPSMTALLP